MLLLFECNYIAVCSVAKVLCVYLRIVAGEIALMNISCFSAVCSD